MTTETNPHKLTLASHDVLAERLEALKELFPEVVVEGKLDIERLKHHLGDFSHVGSERYGLNWAGKAEAIRTLQQASYATLTPMRDDSVNFDTSENLIIEGDNLEVLKLLQKSYHGKVKMIYIDPPYNTGGDFVYPDNFKEGLDTYLKYSGQADDEGFSYSTNKESGGRYHSNWLNMMYPRLFMAKSLLADDGVIFVSIDDHEVANLRMLMNEIFGEDNNVSQVTRIAKRTSDKGTHFRPTKDYIISYARNISLLPEFGIGKNIDESEYKYVDEDGRKYKKSGASLYQPSLDSRPNQRYYIEAPDGSLIIPPGNVFPSERKDGAKVKPQNNADKVWRWSVDSYLRQKPLLIFTEGSSKNPLLDENGNQSKWNIYPKVFFDEDVDATLHPEDVIYDYPNSQSTKELISISIPFDFAKPTGLIGYLAKLINCKNSIILDFFAGSGTTADAVMQLNKEDGGNRKYILVQLPEPTDEKSEAHKAGFPTIAHITRERVRRVIAKLQGDRESVIPTKVGIQSNQQTLGLDPVLQRDDEKGLDPVLQRDDEGRSRDNEVKGQDLGFKAFKLTASNFKLWKPDTAPTDAAELAKQLELYIDNIQPGKTDEAILYEIILKAGLPLTAKIEQWIVPKNNPHSPIVIPTKVGIQTQDREVDAVFQRHDGQLVYVVENGALLVCLADPIEEATLRGMLALKPVKMVALDVAFHGNDQLKTNIRLQSEQTGEGDQSRTQFVTV